MCYLTQNIQNIIILIGDPYEKLLMSYFTLCFQPQSLKAGEYRTCTACLFLASHVLSAFATGGSSHPLGQPSSKYLNRPYANRAWPIAEYQEGLSFHPSDILEQSWLMCQECHGRSDCLPCTPNVHFLVCNCFQTQFSLPPS